MNALAKRRLFTIGAIVIASVVALYPVIGNGFLVVTFDDDAFILDNLYLRSFTWNNARACLSRFYMFDYLPLPMLSYLAEFQFWGRSPAGYHTVNLLLHILGAVLVYVVSARTLKSERAGAFAGLIFALHPVQIESVSVIAQRKTLLATVFLLGSLIAYQRYSDGHKRSYPVACLLYLAACGSKSTVVPFPLLLLLYDYVFQRSRLSLRNKLPFVALALGAAWANLAAKVGSEVLKAPQGGSYLVTALAMSRVFCEYVDALLLPLNLSPSYYYSPAGVLSLSNWLAAAGVVIGIVAVLSWRNRLPLTFFAVGWVGLSLLPVSNIVPIAVLRADRYLYLPMIGFSLWGGAVLSAAQERITRRVRMPLAIVPYVALLVLGTLSWRYTHVWRSDITAWTRVVERHPWNARARYLLADAYAQRQEFQLARKLATESLTIDPAFDRPRQLLADISRQLAEGAAAGRPRNAGTSPGTGASTNESTAN
jgi:hypothetical protein